MTPFAGTAEPPPPEPPPRRCRDCTMRSHGILTDVPGDVFARISCCMTPYRFPARHRIFLEGNPARQVACIRSGRVKLSRQAANGRIQILGVVDVGYLLGHEALAGGTHRTSAETLCESEVCMTSSDELLDQIRRFPDVAIGLSIFLSHRIESLETMMLRLGTLPARQRVAAHLLALARSSGTPRAGANEPERLTLSLSQEIADALGMARETLSRQLSRLSDAGLIAVDGGVIRLRDTAGLQRLAAS